MNVLVACEFSGVVREAFRARGHYAASCDILPAEDGSLHHYQEDALELIARSAGQWDLLIAHPPCTYLTNAGVRWLYKGGKGKERDSARWQKMHEAANFFADLMNAKIPRICIENPIMHSHAGLTLYDQIIQPWQYGHGETKATCLWLHNLPKLVPTNIVEGRKPRVHFASPGPDRWKERSRTLKGIADAMAAQWG